MMGWAFRSLLKAYLIPASLTIGVGLTDSLHLNNDLPFGPAHLEIRKRVLRLIERKYLVDRDDDAPLPQNPEGFLKRFAPEGVQDGIVIPQHILKFMLLVI